MVDYDVAEATGVRTARIQGQNAGGMDFSSVLSDPAYKERYLERLQEGLKKGMDIVQYSDGSISVIENTIRVNYYEWNKRKHDFERAKQARKSSRSTRGKLNTKASSV